MKKHFLLLVMMLLPMVASAYDAYIDGIYYNLDRSAKTAEVTYLNFYGENKFAYSGNIIIPATLKYEEEIYDVVSIGERAFNNCSDLTNLEIPSSVTSIKASAFQECIGLTSLKLPNNLVSIGRLAFAHCKGIQSLIIPNSVTSIEDGAFFDCVNLLSLTLPCSIKHLGNLIFEHCYELAFTISIVDLSDFFNYRIINSLTTNKYFNNSKSVRLIDNDGKEITELKIPNNVSSIGDYDFYRCSGLTSIVFHDGITSFGKHSFEGCSGLTSIVFPASITSLPDYSFAGCSGLSSIVIPDFVTSLGEHSFEGCSGLDTITLLGSAKKEIKNYVFQNCTGFLDFYCYSVLPPKVTPSIFYDSNIKNATLHVPAESVNSYKSYEYWRNFNFKSIVPIEKPKYNLIYYVDNEVYKSYEIEEGADITPEAAPTKEGYTFSGWSEIPQTMPAKDVTVTGTFTINKYKLTYMVDGEEYKSFDIEYGATISPEAWPTKEGYTFSGWSDIPETMPAHDVVVTGTFIQNEQTTEFTVDDVTYDITGEGTVTIVGSDQKGDVEIQSTINVNGQTFYVTAIGYSAFKDNLDMTSLTIPEGITSIGSYAFEGCLNLTVINIGKDVLKIGSMAFANVGTAAAARTRGESPLVVNCYAETVPDAEYDAFLYTPVEDGTLLVNDNLVDEYRMTAPWNYFGKIMGFEEAAGINTISIDSANARIYDMQGNRLNKPQKGVNIIRMKDGKAKKVMVK